MIILVRAFDVVNVAIELRRKNGDRVRQRSKRLVHFIVHEPEEAARDDGKAAAVDEFDEQIYRFVHFFSSIVTLKSSFSSTETLGTGSGSGCS